MAAHPAVELGGQRDSGWEQPVLSSTQSATALSFVPAADVTAAEWDALVDASPDGWVFALSGWQRLILAVQQWGLVDHSFAVRRDSRLVAVVPLQYQAASKRLLSSGWGWAGPALASSLSSSDRAEALQVVFERLDAIASSCGASAIEVGRSPLTLSARLDRTGENPFSRFGYDDCSTQTRVVDLSLDERVLWQGLSKNARQMIRRAQALGYRAMRADWPAHVGEYYRVHSETYRRTAVLPHPRSYFEGLATEMAPRDHAILWAAYAPDGRPVAFHNDARLGPGAVYHTGCSETAHLDSGVNYLLMWTAIVGAQRAGLRWYEVGEVFPDATEGKQLGLTVFKSKFGGALERCIRAQRVLPGRVAAQSSASASSAESCVRNAYEHAEIYESDRICRRANERDTDYAGRLLNDRIDLVRRYYSNGRLVDLCCATGEHLVDFAPEVDLGIGIDFSGRYVRAASRLASARSARNVSVIQGEAGRLPLASGSVHFLYCFSALYAMPRAVDAVNEIGRVLVEGGLAVLDFGNQRSLNAVCVRYYTEWPPIHPMMLSEIQSALAAAGLDVVEHRRFQVLPLWADRPWWLRPVLHPAWARVLKQRLRGRMLDEWVSSLPILRRWAFRHVVVCRKAESSRPC